MILDDSISFVCSIFVLCLWIIWTTEEFGDIKGLRGADSDFR